MGQPNPNQTTEKTILVSVDFTAHAGAAVNPCLLTEVKHSASQSCISSFRRHVWNSATSLSTVPPNAVNTYEATSSGGHDAHSIELAMHKFSLLCYSNPHFKLRYFEKIEMFALSAERKDPACRMCWLAQR